MLEMPGYTIHLNDGQEHHVQVRWADQLLGEREGRRHGITNDLPLHLTTFWCWAALKRSQLYSDDFQKFMNVDLAGIIPDEATVQVPPTEPAPAG